MFTEYFDADLTGRNSFGIRATARRLVEFDSTEALRELFDSPQAPAPGTWKVLGGGNNILFRGDFEGTLLHPTGEQIVPVDRDGDEVTVCVGAGTDWDALVAWSVDEGLWGLENLSAIPGTVGAAPVQNIGAYGTEAADTIRRVEMFCPDERKTLVLHRDHCAFGYRDSVFKHTLRGRTIITSVTFALGIRPHPRTQYGDLSRRVEELGGPNLANIRRAVIDIRREKLPDPAVTGNAGSFFKNPIVDTAKARELQARWPSMPCYPAGGDRVKLACGWLIEQAGWKGRALGRAGVHDRQALVLVNRGGADGADIMALARRVADDVRECFGVEIEPEVNLF